jgi:uncharacterized protein YkwD
MKRSRTTDRDAANAHPPLRFARTIALTTATLCALAYIPTASAHPHPGVEWIEEDPNDCPNRLDEDWLDERPAPNAPALTLPRRSDPPAITLPRRSDPPAIRLPRRDGAPAITLPRRSDPPAIRLPRRDGAPAITLPRRSMRYHPQAMPAPRAVPRRVPQPTRQVAPARPTPAKPAPRTNVATLDSSEARVFALLDATRRAVGLSTLRIDPAATKAARAHSADMCARRYFDHRSPEGSQPWHRLKRAGARFNAAAENIAVGYRSPAAVHRGWMNSPGHRKNRMSSKYSRVGIGRYVCPQNGMVYFTELFLN